MHNIAILGFGTIGSGVYKIASNNKDVNVLKILDKKEKIDPNNQLFTSNLDDILNDSSINTVVEVIGGYEFAHNCIVKALKAKKNVVTANKEVVALAIDELTTLANENGVKFLYEASTGGGIPIIKQISEIRRTSEIVSIQGIINGTTNFILTKMFEGESFENALKTAQKLGFAEADPTADLEGFDLLRKIAILVDLAWNTKIDLNDIVRRGITMITNSDVENAKKSGNTIKFVCNATKDGNDLSVTISPYIVDSNSPLYSVNNECNAIILDTTYNSTLTFIGKGAGSLPTAAAIFGDIYAIINNYVFDTYKNENTYNVIKKELPSSLSKLGE